jgi:membrane protein DedA with SNARE-associated domain
MELKAEDVVFLPTLVTTVLTFISEAVTPNAAAGLVAQLFDPTWNVQNHGVIWTAIVVILFLSGFGLPLPEDIPLTLSGFTTTKEAGDQFVLAGFIVTFLVVVVPILAGDLVAYAMGRKFGFGLRDRSRLIARTLTDQRMTRVRHWFDEYGSFTVFLGRQVAGIRFVTFYTAGTMHMSLAKFVFFDFLGCLLSLPVWLTLGYLAAIYGKAWLDEASRRAGAGFLAGTLIAVLLLIIFAKFRTWRHRSRKATQAPEILRALTPPPAGAGSEPLPTDPPVVDGRASPTTKRGATPAAGASDTT